MKTMTLLVALLATVSLCAQPYIGINVGCAVKTLKGNSPLAQLTLGMSSPVGNDRVSLEYSQCVLNNRNPVYVGGKVGYSVPVGNTAITALYGKSYRMFSLEKGGGNYWIDSYGTRITWKKALFEIHHTQFWQASIGCMYTFN